MQKIFKTKLSLLIIMLTLWSNAMLADDDPGGIDGDPGTPTPATIDNWIPLMFLIGIAIVFFCKYKKKSPIN
jgi:hypothetical protein